MSNLTTSLNRRNFLRATAIGFPAILSSRSAFAAAEYDLVIRGGHVIDPAQKIDGIMDVGIRAGKIAELSAKIPASQSAKSIDATGKLVVPGLIDSHLHARDAEMPPAAILAMGVTTMVDAGSRGADNVDQLVDVARSAPNRMRILLNIARLGNNPQHGEFLDGIDQADTAKATAAVKGHRDYIIGMKARLSQGIAVNRDMEVLRRTVQVAGPLGLPIMIHIGDTFTPLPQILAILRPGDIVTHVYAPTPHGIMDDHGKVLPEVIAARKRGIRFDFSNGLNEHWNWEVSENAFKQGFYPDTISTDLTVAGQTDQVLNLPNVASKFLTMGMPLNDVIARITVNSSRNFRELNPYGSLRKGAVADVTLLELQNGSFDFVDNYKIKRTGSKKLVTKGVVVAGKHIL